MLPGRIGPFSERNGEDKFREELAMYLVVRDLLAEVNAIGGGFASQLTWGSDTSVAEPRACADIMESLFNSTFDHNGGKSVMPFATEKDTQGLHTMMLWQGLSGGNPSLFMDFRKVWTNDELFELIRSDNIQASIVPEWFYDGDNSGSASLNWAAKPGASVEECMAGVAMPLVDPDYFPGGGCSITFVTPGGIKLTDGRMAFHAPTGKFSLLWDEGVTVGLLSPSLTEAVISRTTKGWPHTFIRRCNMTPEQAGAYAPANHSHAIWKIPLARIGHWCDLAGVRNVHASVMPKIENGHRPMPLERLLDGSLPTA
jgi:L-fucose isomerase